MKIEKENSEKEKGNSVAWKLFIGWGTKEVATMAIVIALNSMLIIAFNPISWGPMQFRIAEIITVPMYMAFGYVGAIALLLSSFVTVWFVPGGMVAGEFLWNWAMFLFWGIVPVMIVKRLKRTTTSYQITALYTAVCTAIWVPTMLQMMWDVPFVVTFLPILASEIITMNILGYALWKGISKRLRSVIPELH